MDELQLTWYDPPEGYARYTPGRGAVITGSAGSMYTVVRCDLRLRRSERAVMGDRVLPGWNLLRAEGAQDVAMLEALAEARYALA